MIDWTNPKLSDVREQIEAAKRTGRSVCVSPRWLEKVLIQLNAAFDTGFVYQAANDELKRNADFVKRNRPFANQTEGGA